MEVNNSNIISDTDFDSIVNNLYAPIIISITSRKRCCKCKKIRCRKRYCECYAKGVNCTNCDHVMCLNRHLNIKLVAISEPAGCNCQNSECLKKYCICFKKDIECNSLLCKCTNCLNKSM
jgi:hypothetical protein